MKFKIPGVCRITTSCVCVKHRLNLLPKIPPVFEGIQGRLLNLNQLLVGGNVLWLLVPVGCLLAIVGAVLLRL